MRFFYFFLISFYFVTVAVLAFLPVEQYPYLACSSFFISHIILYIVLVNKNIQHFNSSWVSFSSILILAIVLRFLFVWVPPSSDAARYAWEGKMVANGGNPYLNTSLWFMEYDIQDMSTSDKLKLKKLIEKKTGLSQKIADFSDSDFCYYLNELIKKESLEDYLNRDVNIAFDEKLNLQPPNTLRLIQNRIIISRYLVSLEDKIQEQINHKDMAAVYPPLTLLIFGLLMKIHYSLEVFKLFFILCDLLTIACICHFLKKIGKPIIWSLFYVMSPLVLIYGVGKCHLDIMQNTFLVVGLYCCMVMIEKKWVAFGFFLLGCAVVVKYVAIIVLPFLVAKKKFSFLLYFLIPFFSFIFFIDSKIWSSLYVFSSQMHFNDAIPRLLREFGLMGSSWYVVLSLIIFIMGYILIWLLYQEVPLKGMLYAWVWLLVCLPVVHPWYIIPVSLLLCCNMMRSFYFLSFIMGIHFFILAYQLTHNGVWMEFWWVPTLTYVGFLAFYLYEVNFLSKPFSENYEMPNSLDIVVPVLNEEQKIDSFLNQLFLEIDNLCKHKNIKTNVVVVDGGSQDKSLLMLQKYPVKVLVSEKVGRGHQMALGSKDCMSSVVLFLHIDSVLVKNCLLHLIETLERNSTYSWGVLGHKYDNSSLKLRFVDILNRFRFYFFGIAFGDQGIFVRRKVLDQIGFPEIPLMEDVELSMRLFKFPNRVNLNNQLIASARRWKKNGFVFNFTQVVFLCLKYLFCRRLGVDINTLTEKIFKSYYAK